MDRRFAVAACLLVLSMLMLNSLALPASASKSRQLLISVQASSPVFAGQTVQISATLQYSNGTAEGNKASFAGSHVYYPNGTAVALSATPTVTAPELVRWGYILPSNAPNGLYSVTIRATLGPNATWGQASFTVNNQIASANGLNAISSQLSSVSSQLGLLSSDMKENFTDTLNAVSSDFASMQGQVGSLSASMAENFTALSGTLATIGGSIGSLATSASVSDLKATVQSDIGGINSMIGSIATSAQVSAISSGVQSLQTQASNISNVENYVLLPAMLAAIVLILIVLIRRR
ncbi:MAG: hypothetical protein HY296_06270 [Thaumarchaeota archaeon]|nr:hypothetical protein [Nitrososphaerota archaeon]